jgi:MFS transporter, CP family, cyanate transporter
MMVGFSGLAWIAPLYASLGFSSQQSANRLVLFQVVQLATMLTLPALTDHVRDRRPLLAFGLICTCAGLTMLLVDPVGLSMLAMLLFGAGVGGGSTLGLVLIVDSTTDQHDAARLGAMVLMVAFLAAACGPALLGLLRDLTGDFAPGYAMLLLLSIAMLLVTAVYRPGRSIHD